MKYQRNGAKRKAYKKRTGGKAPSTRAVKQIVNRAMHKAAEVKNQAIQWDEQNLSTLSQSPDTSGVRKILTTISQGTDRNNRIGNQIKAIGVSLRYCLHGVGIGTTWVRVLLLRPRNVIDSTDTLDNTLLEDGNTDTPLTTGATGLNCIYYPINKESHIVLYDRVHRLGNSGASDGNNTIFCKKFIKLNQKVIYTSSSSTSERYGQMVLTAFAAEAQDDTTSGQNVEMSGVVKLFYTDT